MTILVYIIGVIVLFIILREAVTWYWKINKLVSLNTETRDLLRQIERNTSKGKASGVATGGPLNVGDGVRFTDEKFNELNAEGSLKDLSATNGVISKIDSDYVQVKFGNEERLVKMEDLQKLN